MIMTKLSRKLTTIYLSNKTLAGYFISQTSLTDFIYTFSVARMPEVGYEVVLCFLSLACMPEVGFESVLFRLFSFVFWFLNEKSIRFRGAGDNCS